MSIRKQLPTAAAVCTALLLTLCSTAAPAAGIEWGHDLKAAAETSGRTGRPMLLKFTASWCGYCRKMKAETFSDSRIVDHVAECFIPVEVDADRNPRLMQAIGIKGLPTTVIVSPELKVVQKLTGYQTADQLDRQLSQICQATHRRSSDATPSVTQAAATAPPATQEQPRVSEQASGAAAPATDYSFAGRCLVTLVDKQQLAPGDQRFTVDWKHRKVCFAGRAELDAFLTNPDRYWPELGGGCPVTAVDENALVEGQPELGVLYRGRIWFFRSEADLARFEKNPGHYVDSITRNQPQ